MTSMAVETPAAVTVRPFTRWGVLGVWCAAALPMAALSWVVAPAVAGPAPTPARFVTVLVAAMTAGLVWQCALVLLLVAREQRSLRPRVLRAALWLVPPSTVDGRRGGRLWWWALVFLLATAALQFLPTLRPPAGRDFGLFLSSTAGHEVLRGNWPFFALAAVMLLFNTVLGEELLFRGLLLPRMQVAFGRADWVANAVLFGLYHLHQPWGIPGSIASGLLYAYPARRWRSAWLGIIVHSAESVVIATMILLLVLG